MFNKIFKKNKLETPKRIDLIIKDIVNLLEEKKVNIFELMDIDNYIHGLTFQNFDTQLKGALNKIKELETKK